MFKFNIKSPLANISSTFFFFDLPLKLRIVYLRNKQTNSVTNMEFYKHVQYCFCCYVIKSAGTAANKILLPVVWNPLLIKINLSQIRTLEIKREKVCAACPYLLLIFQFRPPSLSNFKLPHVSLIFIFILCYCFYKNSLVWRSLVRGACTMWTLLRAKWGSNH